MTLNEKLQDEREAGRVEGKQEGQIAFAIALVKDGTLSKTQAAEKLQMPLKTFEDLLAESEEDE